jgi:glycyl-tRNA synthetase beta chain
MFALGLQPTGSKDPFALRRAANGIVKIIAEHKLPLPIAKLFSDARAEYADSEAERRFSKEIDFDEALANFMRERLEFYLRDARGFAYDVVNAVLAAGCDDIVDAIARAEAVSEVRGSEDFVSISIAFKRIKNIVRPGLEQERKRDDNIAVGITFQNPEYFEAGAERDLAMLMPSFLHDIQQLAKEKNYREALAKVAALRCPVDMFFDKVMVMVDDEAVRARRILMLFFLLAGVSTIADFSEIVTEGK